MPHHLDHFGFKLEYFDKVGSNLEIDIVNNISLCVVVGWMVISISFSFITSIGFGGRVSKLGWHTDIQYFVSWQFRLQKSDHV